MAALLAVFPCASCCFQIDLHRICVRRDLENELVPRLQSLISPTTPSREAPESGVEVSKVLFLVCACMYEGVCVHVHAYKRVHVCVVLPPSFFCHVLLPVKGGCEQETRGQRRAAIVVDLGEGLVYCWYSSTCCTMYTIPFYKMI